MTVANHNNLDQISEAEILALVPDQMSNAEVIAYIYPTLERLLGSYTKEQIQKLHDAAKYHRHQIKQQQEKILARIENEKFRKERYKKAPLGKIYVNVYEINREYGGSEEGGWWYNNQECVDSKLVSAENAKRWQRKFAKQYKGYGDIYSVRGGTQYRIEIQRMRAQSETRERPYYN